MKTQIIEICLTDGRGIEPFAVIVEGTDECGWSIAADPRQERDQDWISHVLATKGRRASEWWVLDAWRSWLRDVAEEPSERRSEALRQLEASTPGILVKCPRMAETRLPPGALARRWRRRRLHDRAEVIAAEVVSRLSRRGTAYWSSALFAEGHEPLQGDWVVAYRPDHRAPVQAERSASGVISYFFRSSGPPSSVETDTMLVVVRIIDHDQLDFVLQEWANARVAMGAACPFGLAVVRGQHSANLGEGIAVVGDRFPAPVLLAVAAVRAHEAIRNYSARGGVPVD